MHAKPQAVRHGTAMAATDKPYRNQYRLDVVFGVTCILLLGSTVWMMYDDHYRAYKPVQRTFRDVEEALYVQSMDEKFPESKLAKITEAQGDVDKAKESLDKAKEGVSAKVGEDAATWLKKQDLEKATLEAAFQDKMATYNSVVSLYNIAVDDRDTAPTGSHKEKLAKEADDLKKQIAGMDKEVQDIQTRLSENEKKTADALSDQKKAEDDLSNAQDTLKKLTDDFDRTAKLAAQKRWKMGDWFRSLPILDGFASAYKIQQITLEDLTIEYGSFKNVPRYDRCTTCHMAIDRAAFDKVTLRGLALTDDQRRDELNKRHAAALQFLDDRVKRKENLGFDPSDLGKSVPSIKLTDAQVTQYCAHPRLDLFVDANSAHPMEKFGCTICHNGQGSATDFTLAVHTPDNADQKKAWQKNNGWEPFHDWEYPMLPPRFVESSCLKCHHQVTDLVRYGSKEEAPKLLKGYNLIRENGCFGCHEISGIKSGKAVGPDLRLEPSPSMDELTPAERAKLLSDPTNPPGTLRKIGPSLRRISEKVTEPWMVKWINRPRGFRPDTKMPHFYNLSNNIPEALPDEPGNRQKEFPAAEISSMARYLFAESTKYVNHTDTYLTLLLKREAELKEMAANNTISAKQRDELIEVQRRIELAGDPRLKKRSRVADQILAPDGTPVAKKDVDEALAPATDKDRDAGRKLFTERGCLGCHTHAGTQAAGITVDGVPVAPVTGSEHFGPTLTRTAAKINGDKGRRWLVQWLTNPTFHNPRTRMPIMHLTTREAGQIADWLVSQPVDKDKAYQEWDEGVTPPTKETLIDLARVYLKKAPNINPLEVEGVLANGFTKERAQPPLMAADADEHALLGPITEDKLQLYIGKKAITRQGCFGCHDIPGFEFSKPVGTPLNDWGKKDPARLAFENIDAFVEEHYTIVERRDDPKDPSKPSTEWTKAVIEGKKPPVEKFFADALEHRQRDGYLHQKLNEPRSYDYDRDVKWDDRLRMPQFKFAHPTKNEGESDDEFRARTDQAEAEAREAVMTFILGLVAEPIAGRYLNNPNPDRLAEVKGRQVIDKFNCTGCHQVRPGIYQFKGNDDTRKLLGFTADTLANKLTTDFGAQRLFAAHNAWGNPTPASMDRLVLHAVRPVPRKPTGREQDKLELNPDSDLLSMRLTQAVSFVDPSGRTRVIPASEDVPVFKDQLVSGSPAYGGTVAELLVPYLGARGGDYELKNNDSNVARRDLPPPLAREGEKVQPDWLYDFLRKPTPIRPQVILRMPKFNMSEDDARALVNYFGAADRTGNPGIGLTYPYMTVPQREDVYWKDKAQGYWQRTNQGQGLADRLKKLQDTDLIAAKKKLDEAKGEAEQKDAKRLVAVVNAQIDALQQLAGKPETAAESLYWHDAYKLIATPGKSICLDCHRVGAVTVPKEQGPPLELSYKRLRPGWTEYWSAYPDRLLTYPSVMPQNFQNGVAVFQDLMPADSLYQVGAIRDVLMNLPRVADTPLNRSYRAAITGAK